MVKCLWDRFTLSRRLPCREVNHREHNLHETLAPPPNTHTHTHTHTHACTRAHTHPPSPPTHTHTHPPTHTHTHTHTHTQHSLSLSEAKATNWRGMSRTFVPTSEYSPPRVAMPRNTFCLLPKEAASFSPPTPLNKCPQHVCFRFLHKSNLEAEQLRHYRRHTLRNRC